MADTLQLAPQLKEPPASPVEGVEPLLTVDQLTAWTGWSRTTIYKYRQRDDDPLPSIGGVQSLRFLPSEVLAWMRRESARTAAAA